MQWLAIILGPSLGFMDHVSLASPLSQILAMVEGTIETKSA